ncbi:UDP-3-O-(3-hydroxymyristoyl)glucosamine N-acyltransferase [Methyloradius palustris]|uniref:UDP-3-O-acylglucosamine N-acyltransferase n=1 Tax=Methyloradius palustris TaxID=2778876 RepID=A0A8D5JLN3_9PROT|nr:UDP-3-O-(3-hydroxymyristoyl)glucosamine N-acyltransferase [Methyloradius palustris]BCM25045.1 UDP-3-O-acylglucosamine N-acyltransferase [Methyloradius palustris]
MSKTYSLQEIVSVLGGLLVDGSDTSISRVASITNAQQGHITFLRESKYRSQLATTKASAVILSPENQALTQLPRIVTDNPYAYFARVSELLNSVEVYAKGIHQTAVIDASARVPASCAIAANVVIGSDVILGENVVIGNNCSIGRGVVIGENTTLQANVSVYHDCILGKHCIVAAGTVIGADGFGYANYDVKWVKIPQVGRVIIEDHVEIGANTTIDRGALDDTVIETGCKLDNLIQIGHNCRIGEHSVIAGCVGIAGSAVIGKRCKIGGAAMILGHLEIADDVTISPGSMITRSLTKADTYTALMPFQTHGEWLKTAANIRRVGNVNDRLKELERELAKVKSQLDSTKPD